MATDNQLVAALQARANRLRIDSIESTSAAGSGHPTTALSCAEIMASLFFKAMKYDPKDPRNPLNDRFVLSKGHGAPALYSVWSQVGFIPHEQLNTLRRIDSDLEGHPTPRLAFVDVATGSLGQGLSAGVGLALNSKYLDKTDYRTYVLMGDGEVAEGAVWEAAELGSYYRLDNLVAIVDVNRLGQSQQTMLEHHTEVYRARFEAFGWEAVAVDGHDIPALLEAFDRAAKTVEKPFAIIARTIKGKGVDFAADKNGWHGKPFKGEEEQKALAEVRAAGIDSPIEIAIQKPTGTAPAAPKIQAVEPPAFKKGDLVATREAYGEALVKVGKADSRVVVFDADTKNSTYSDKFMKAFPERFFECFIAEQNMITVGAAISSRNKIPFVSTFAVFLSRGFDQVRMAGVSKSNLKLCGSHVGVSIGEDGPSQMGLEDLAIFRTIPNCAIFYPSDAVSTERAVALAAAHQGMAYIRTSRPKSAVIYDNDELFEIGRSKVVRHSDKDVLTVVAGGVTFTETLKAYEILKSQGISIRVIDIFSVKPVDAECMVSNGRETNNTIITVEDHYPEGGIGEAVLSATAPTGVRVHMMAVREVPRSGKPEELVAKYGIDSEAIVARVKQVAALL